MLTIRIKIMLVVLFAISIALGYAITRFSRIQDSLLPRQQSAYPWSLAAGTDVGDGGASTVDLKDSTYTISADFNLIPAIRYPYVTLGLYLESDTNPLHMEDWSSYSSITLRIKCRPANVLNLAVLTYDDEITRSLSDVRMLRPSLAFVSCGEEWQTVRIDLTRLEMAEWWMQKYKVNLANRNYSLKKVRGIALSSSTQSRVNTSSNIIIQELALERKSWPVITTLVAVIVLLWLGFLSWLVHRFYFSQRETRISDEVIPVVYQPVPVEPKHEREKEAVLTYMASKYVNPDLSVDIAVKDLGINRIKINEILRAETGLTFSIYLNKLRLAEAARLLADPHVGVAEAAFAVGYNSLSYFNRLFKAEHGCNPSAYKGATSGPKTPVDV